VSAAVVIARWSEPLLPDGFDDLASTAQSEGWAILARCRSEWAAGAQFNRPGECLFTAKDGAPLVGIAAISGDPYANVRGVGRLRHVYVDPRYRLAGLASRLVRECLATTGGHFTIIRARTSNPNAARVYERLGFRPVDQTDATHVLVANGL
jgi:GNAT superfamily N-acetyltransferase